MLRTMWFALFCLAVLGAMITFKVATVPAPLAVAATHDQPAIGIPFGPNTAAKSDRLPIPDIRKPTEADPVPPVATTMPVEAPSSSLETTNNANQRDNSQDNRHNTQKDCAPALARFQRQADCRLTASPACESQTREDKRGQRSWKNNKQRVPRPAGRIR